MYLKSLLAQGDTKEIRFGLLVVLPLDLPLFRVVVFVANYLQVFRLGEMICALILELLYHRLLILEERGEAEG